MDEIRPTHGILMSSFVVYVRAYVCMFLWESKAGANACG